MTEISITDSNKSCDHNGNGQQVSEDHQGNGSVECGLPQQSNSQQQKKPAPVKKSSALVLRFLGFNSTNIDDKAECTTREIGTLIMFGVLLIIFIISVTGFFIMWFTEAYNNSITSKLVLANGSTASEWWTNPPITPHLRVHIFNYTNIDRYLKGIDTRLKVVDLGPYTYVENSTKVNISYNSNYTITYKENRFYSFVPELSAGKQYDQVVVPNIPLISAIASLKNQNGFMKMAASVAITSLDSTTFKRLAADSFLWGYDDKLIDLSRTFSDKTLPFKRFGMLTNRNGTSHDTFQIYTGEDDIRKLATISEFNGEKSMNFWSTDECNRVDGTDGSQFPPYLMDRKKPLEVYIQALCRKLPLVFDSEVNLFDGVPAWRYKAPLNVFAHPDINPDNQCFCHIETGVCPPSGLFNGTTCYNAPIFISFPHFYTGDPNIYKDLDGIYPNASLHETYADIHPRMAFPIDGASRFQINIQIQKSGIHSPLKALEEGSILPVIWVEMTSGELNDELRAMIYHSSFSANAIQIALKYGTLLTCVTSLALLVAACYYRGRNKDVWNKQKTVNNLANVKLTKIENERFAQIVSA